MQENELTVIAATRITYDSERGVATVFELGFDGYIEINIDKRRYEKDTDAMLKDGYLDWSRYEGCCYESDSED